MSVKFDIETPVFDTSMLINEQILLSTNMLHNNSDMKTTYNKVINEINETSNRLNRLHAEEYHLRHIIKFNNNMTDTLAKQMEYLNNPPEIPEINFNNQNITSNVIANPENLYMNIDNHINTNEYLHRDSDEYLHRDSDEYLHRDSNDRDSNDRDSNDRDSNDRDSNDRDSNDRDSDDRDSNEYLHRDSNDRDSNDRYSNEYLYRDSDDRDSNDRYSDDRDSNDRDFDEYLIDRELLDSDPFSSRRPGLFASRSLDPFASPTRTFSTAETVVMETHNNNSESDYDIINTLTEPTAKRHKH
jgi:hypothetical protein